MAPMDRASKGRALLWTIMVVYVLVTSWNFLHLDTDRNFRLSKGLNSTATVSTADSQYGNTPHDLLHVDVVVLLSNYKTGLVAQVDAQPEQPLSPATQRLKDAIEGAPHLYMYFTEMFTQIPPEARDGQNETVLRDHDHMLRLLSHIVKTAPPPGLGIPVPPMALILTDPSNTASGHAAFADPQVNLLLKGVLNEWADFLGSADSLPFVQNGVDGWLDKDSLVDLERVANIRPDSTANFSDLFEYFFTRRFRPHVRPVAEPDDDSVIINACESVPHTVGMKAKLRDTFFIKDQPYSVLDMLGHDPIADEFADATVYQAFLSMHSYHRWHAPISGRIRSAYVVDGTYYSMPRFFGADQLGMTFPRPPAGFGHAMRYLSEMATRAVIIIEADHPGLGLVAFVAVGMVEISTCEITVQEGQHVKKGDELGSFHFGGSSYCLLFQDGVELTDLPTAGDFQSPNMPVLSKLAVVSSPSLVVQA